MGSPEFALPTLRALAERYPVVGVVTQPDRPAGRGRRLSPPPVKTLAESLGLPVIQPPRLGEEEAMSRLHAWAPDLIVVAAFGQILRPKVLDLPPFGCLNVHASLLPRWRGAAPVQAAILQGDDQSGVTIMKMDAGVDTGPILNQRALPILPDDTAGSLSQRLAQLGAELLLETLPAYLSGEITPRPQEGEATYAPMLRKEDGMLDLTLPADALARKVRAFNPWPGAFTIWRRQALKVHLAHAVNDPEAGIAEPTPGARAIWEGKPAILTGHGLLVLDVVQPAGKRPMSGEEFLRGARDWTTNMTRKSR